VRVVMMMKMNGEVGGGDDDEDEEVMMMNLEWMLTNVPTMGGKRTRERGVTHGSVCGWMRTGDDVV
jgi:hypothetical protein